MTNESGPAERDVCLMREAIALGEQGRRTSAPNPWVGCVITSADGVVVSEGFHRRAGEPHAEVHALRAAGANARGGTAYVTLEPCSHIGRTPPCVDALIRARVARVVVAVRDPDPVARGGLERLEQAGVRVDLGVCAGEAADSLRPYLHHREQGRPLCIAKTAVTLDGRTAAEDGTSQWITGPAARADTHRMRGESQAIVVGAGTALADLPTLTVREVEPPPETQPLRVLLDAKGRVTAKGPLFDTSLAPTLVITTPHADACAEASWRRAGAEVAVVPEAAEGSGVDLHAAFGLLGRRGVLQALIEGGPILHGACLRAGLVDRLVLYIGARSLGERGRPLFAGNGPRTIGEAQDWQLLSVNRLGPDVRLEFEPLHEVKGPIEEHG